MRREDSTDATHSSTIDRASLVFNSNPEGFANYVSTLLTVTINAFVDIAPRSLLK